MTKSRVAVVATIFFIIGFLIGTIIILQNDYRATTFTTTITIPSPVTITTTKTISQTEPSIEILGTYFSPKGGCAEQIIYWINSANSSIHVLIYSFTLSNIADALIDAKNRGIDVKVVFEKGQISQYSQYFRLANAGISVRNDTNPDYMHNKVAIIDGIIVLTGSYNWSSSAENSNNENLIIIKSVDVAREYENVFIRIWEHGR